MGLIILYSNAIVITYERILYYQISDFYTDTSAYMEGLSGENSDEYWNTMDDEIYGLIKR